jgi:hypothetical protein
MDGSSAWYAVDELLRWINGGFVHPELERPVEDRELILLILVIALIVAVVWDAMCSRAREQERREQQDQWRRQLQERMRRLRIELSGQGAERLGPTP